jgi:hypothetical protein
MFKTACNAGGTRRLSGHLRPLYCGNLGAFLYCFSCAVLSCKKSGLMQHITLGRRPRSVVAAAGCCTAKSSDGVYVMQFKKSSPCLCWHPVVGRSLAQVCQGEAMHQSMQCCWACGAGHLSYSCGHKVVSKLPRTCLAAGGSVQFLKCVRAWLSVCVCVCVCVCWDLPFW